MQQACIRPKGTVRVGMRMLGCITQAYTLCARPAPHLYSFKTKDRAWSQQQRHQQFNGYGTLYLWSKVLERHHPTGCGRQMSVDRTRQQSCWGWVWGLPVIGESHLIGSLATRDPSSPALVGRFFISLNHLGSTNYLLMYHECILVLFGIGHLEFSKNSGI